jgi:hypothetical protein
VSAATTYGMERSTLILREYTDHSRAARVLVERPREAYGLRR